MMCYKFYVCVLYINLLNIIYTHTWYYNIYNYVCIHYFIYIHKNNTFKGVCSYILYI